MTQSLFANNEQAKQLWEGKITEMQKEIDRLEGVIKDKESTLGQARTQMQQATQKYESTIREKDSQLREAREKTEQQQIDKFAHENATKASQQKAKES